jgi:hypothetical protein
MSASLLELLRNRPIQLTHRQRHNHHHDTDVRDRAGLSHFFLWSDLGLELCPPAPEAAPDDVGLMEQAIGSAVTAVLSSRSFPLWSTARFDVRGEADWHAPLFLPDGRRLLYLAISSDRNTGHVQQALDRQVLLDTPED